MFCKWKNDVSPTTLYSRLVKIEKNRPTFNKPLLGPSILGLFFHPEAARPSSFLRRRFRSDDDDSFIASAAAIVDSCYKDNIISLYATMFLVAMFYV